MSNKITSIRGEIVDFDILTIKEQILNTPKTDQTKNRERFIDKKRRRISRNSVDQLLAQQQPNQIVVNKPVISEIVTTESELKKEIISQVIIKKNKIDEFDKG